VGAAGVDASGRQLQNPDGPASHPVATPAEHDRVESAGQDPLEQHLSLFLMKQPAKDEVHRAPLTVSGSSRQSKGKVVKKV
jgi:hypothetical protein